MLGPFTANKDRTISYKGNRLFAPISNIENCHVPVKDFEKRAENLKKEKYWSAIARINNQINQSANEYFAGLGALFTILPITTRMISSPGAVYGKEAINYTTDTCPITLKWFDLSDNAFLSESSQIYLEIALLQDSVDQVYSIYNSFRKEKADATHLSEFHHIEYEGKVSQIENEKIALNLVQKILFDLVSNNNKDLLVFLTQEKVDELQEFAKNIDNVPKITFREALDALYQETKDERYKSFTMQNNFGSWEEVKLTEIFGSMVCVREFPLLEVPFYHAEVDGKTPKVANNTDIIWPGYRETVGSGHRVKSIKELEDKAEIFNLPLKDYAPYLMTRKMERYSETSGFGLGWERLLQGLLEMPFIWSASHFPRVDKTLKI